jgi:ABC-type sulfate transport system substrate-binding protein
MRQISLALLMALFLPALATGAPKDTKLTLVAYSTPKEAYGQLISAFQKTTAGNGVSFVRDDGETLSAQLTREQVEALELQHGQIVYVRPTRQTVFAD